MRDPETGWIQLHPGEFFLLWTSLDLGELPAGLGVPNIGRTPGARAQFTEAASAALADRGLGTVRRPAGDLEELLRALAGGWQVLELDVDTPEVALRAIGATGDGATAVAARVNLEVRVGPARDTNLIPTLLEVLSPLDAGRGTSANISVLDFDGACAAGADGGSAGFAEELEYVGLRGAEVNTVGRAITGRSAGGRLGARARASDGHWWRAPATLNWVDTDDGRYAIRRNGEWVTVTPVDHHRLLAMAEDMVAALRN